MNSSKMIRVYRRIALEEIVDTACFANWKQVVILRKLEPYAEICIRHCYSVIAVRLLLV
jgi:hypothetical protein